MGDARDNAPGGGPPEETKIVTPLVGLAICWVLGVVLGRFCGGVIIWLTLATLATGPMVWHQIRKSPNGVRCWGVIVLVAVSAGWTDLRIRHVTPDDISRYIGTEPRLARITGVVEGPGDRVSPDGGAFARFTHQSTTQQFVLRTESIHHAGHDRVTSGRVLLRFNEPDHRVRDGDRVRVTGWLGPFVEPMNPGQRDYKSYMARRGIEGRITLPGRENWGLIQRSSVMSPLRHLRQTIADEVARSLRIGMDHDTVRLGFLDRVLLGRREIQIDELETGFRRVGLAHLLSISGAHLGILLGWVYVFARLLSLQPQRAATLVLIVLGLYLIAVPWRVPIVRAGVMTGLLCTGFSLGRSIRALDLMGSAGVVLLMWRPPDLFTPGFQLSFGVVIGLLLFTRGASHRLWADPPVILDVDRGRVWITRWVANFIAAHLVAFLIASPLVAFHFGIVSPLTVLLGVLAYPWVTWVIAVGHLKIAVGLILPSLGVILAGLLEFLADVITGLVDHASGWPAAVVELSHRPSPGWTIAALMLATGWLGGWFVGRRAGLWTALTICLVWLIGPGLWPVPAWPPVSDGPDPVLRVNMFSVGDGSCYLVRIGGSLSEKKKIATPATQGHPSSGTTSQARGDEINDPSPHVLMFDCGSRSRWDLGTKMVVPALRELGVRSIDTLMLSHPDLDHFSGVLGLIDRVPVRRVLVSAQMMDDAQRNPNKATGFLIQRLRSRGVDLRVVRRGWRETRGCGDLELLWPPPPSSPPPSSPDDSRTLSSNDMSLVLSIRVLGRRLLLNGDIQQPGIDELLGSGVDLCADISDLPHHGSFVRDSPRWVRAVNPSVVLQSCGPGRLATDPWDPLLSDLQVKRLITAESGMVEVVIDRDGELGWTTFRSP